ncbi:hypothetical protein D791_00907 [Nitrincola nitratireducens]|uniref:Uncharacterized protein n=1 Tax=Nitrincola nitratireducens TaxID=1229521 RepID=W9VNG4_9GAMM|nr:hypothetical protein D791_00907 [Nitrincola nitratireducens]
MLDKVRPFSAYMFMLWYPIRYFDKNLVPTFYLQ